MIIFFVCAAIVEFWRPIAPESAVIFTGAAEARPLEQSDLIELRPIHGFRIAAVVGVRMYVEASPAIFLLFGFNQVLLRNRQIPNIGSLIAGQRIFRAHGTVVLARASDEVINTWRGARDMCKRTQNVNKQPRLMVAGWRDNRPARNVCPGEHVVPRAFRVARQGHVLQCTLPSN